MSATPLRFGSILTVWTDRNNLQGVRRVNNLAIEAAIARKDLFLGVTNTEKPKPGAVVPTAVHLEREDAVQFLTEYYNVTPGIIDPTKNLQVPQMVPLTFDPGFKNFFNDYIHYLRTGEDRIGPKIYDYAARRNYTTAKDTTNHPILNILV